MTAPDEVRRDGRTCDECGGPNFPSGWLDSSWNKYVSDPDSRGEGYSGVVLCALCYADRVERQSGAEEALNVSSPGSDGGSVLTLWRALGQW